MNSLLDLLLHEIVRVHQQELLESARVSRMLMNAGPASRGRMLLAFWRRFRRRKVSSQARSALEGASHSPCHNRVSCQRLGARKTVA